MPNSGHQPIQTRFGPLSAWVEGDGSLRVEWGRGPESTAAVRTLPRDLMSRLARAADGKPAAFSDVPIPDGTPFQRKCWMIAKRIPRGATLTYGEVARRAGAPGAARAVGQAMRRNPTPLVVPCHRVVASSGLGGYSGTDRDSDPRCRCKAELLRLEGATAANG